MNIYYVVASYKRSPEFARFAVTAETPEQATAEVMDEHCGRNLWDHVSTTYIGRKSDRDPEFFSELP
jgi:hypothetical protein